MKKIFKIAGTLFFNMSLGRENISGDIDLASLTKLNQANAECVQPDPMALGPFGRCYAMYYNPTCVIDNFASQCDPHY
jgi:hypothetical protein